MLIYDLKEGELVDRLRGGEFPVHLLVPHCTGLWLAGATKHIQVCFNNSRSA